MKRGAAQALLALLAALLLPSGARAEEAAAPAAQKVADGKKVSLELTIAFEDGKQADSNVGGPPFVYEQGAGEFLPAVENELEGLAVNDRKRVTVSAKDAFGEIDPRRVKQVPIEQIPEAARKPGAELIGVDEQGRQMPVRIQKIDGDDATVDLNHPLAGHTLIFDVKIVAIE
jgi:FKBP-type peptidyl-prolyl cis-trans isomerase 2